MKFRFNYLQDQSILDTANHPELGGNINGPSLMQVPDWVVEPLGRYYLYFAHHEGKQIHLAVADNLTGPWTVYEPGALSLEQSLFCQHSPLPSDTHPDVLKAIAAGTDGDYPHIASPDVHVDVNRQKIMMYYHGRNPDGTQQTRLAESVDGITFTPFSTILGDSYFRVFKYQHYHYAIAWGSKLYRSSDSGRTFEVGPRLTKEGYRHGAILRVANTDTIYVIWSRAGDCPESLLISRLLMTDSATSNLRSISEVSDWKQWRLGAAQLLHKPERSWEGIDEPLLPSSYGGIMRPVNEVRDPCIYEEDGVIYILYSIRGEQGIAIATITV